MAETPITVGNATVTAPIAGQTPSFTAVSDDPIRYSVELLRWIDVEENMDINSADLTNTNGPYYNYKFEMGKKYEAVVKFTGVNDYELSYTNSFTINGEKTNYTLNGLNRTYIFTAKAPSTITAKAGNVFTVTGNEYIKNCYVILALYKDGGSKLADCQAAKYTGEPITFTTTATDYTSAKVMVWKSLDDIEPVADVEIVDLK